MDEQFIINYLGINATSIYHETFAKAVHALVCLLQSLQSLGSLLNAGPIQYSMTDVVRSLVLC